MIQPHLTSIRSTDPEPATADLHDGPRPVLVLLRGGRAEAPRAFVVAPPAVSAVIAAAAAASTAAASAAAGRRQSRERRAGEVDPYRCRLARTPW